MMLGEKIKKLRIDKKMSIRELSKKSDVSNGYLSDLERGIENNPSLKKLMNISTALECTISQLIGECET